MAGTGVEDSPLRPSPIEVFSVANCWMILLSLGSDPELLNEDDTSLPVPVEADDPAASAAIAFGSVLREVSSDEAPNGPMKQNYFSLTASFRKTTKSKELWD